MLLIENNKLIKEWNYEKNKDINIDLLTIGSSKIVWWKCEKEQEWEARVSARNDGNGCPFCSGSPKPSRT